jgi:hypothetical protein
MIWGGFDVRVLKTRTCFLVVEVARVLDVGKLPLCQSSLYLINTSVSTPESPDLYCN